MFALRGSKWLPRIIPTTCLQPNILHVKDRSGLLSGRFVISFLSFLFAALAAFNHLSLPSSTGGIKH
jgi:hypothetical protein